MTRDAIAQLVAQGARSHVDPRSPGVARVGEAAHPSITYRPELDGIRAVAVLLVMAAHLGIAGLLGGGRMGYQAFFVLSGYLITTLLIREHARNGRIDLRAFYVRRIRRLVPALVTMVGIVTALAFLAGRGGDVAYAALSSVLYVANWTIPDDQLGLFGHTWTLAVEEQFYLVWPALVILAFRGRLGLAVALAAAAAAWILLPAFWIIEVGCLAAVIAERASLRLRMAPLAAAAATLVLCLATTPVDGALLTVAAVAAAVLVLDGSWLTVKLLAPLAPLGRISYGVYLWHLPIVRVGLAISPVPFALTVPALVALSILAGWASSVLVERRFRSLRRSPSQDPEREVGRANVGAVVPDEGEARDRVPLHRDRVDVVVG
jgi:peptidoglycan/LPS O-acetylase OafA/YrhL